MDHDLLSGVVINTVGNDWARLLTVEPPEGKMGDLELDTSPALAGGYYGPVFERDAAHVLGQACDFVGDDHWPTQ